MPDIEKETQQSGQAANKPDAEEASKAVGKEREKVSQEKKKARQAEMQITKARTKIRGQMRPGRKRLQKKMRM